MQRIVIKIGTKVLSQQDGSLDVVFLANLVEQIVRLRTEAVEMVLVTSGAVGSGKSLLSLKDIKSEVVQKQIYAAVGQVKLMTIYSESFDKYGYLCAQVLATKEDFRDEEHYRNMQNCFEGLLLDNVIPIINENDTVATAELMFTDNDELAGLVAKQLSADALIILTSTTGILDAAGNTVAEVNSSNVEVVAGYINPDKSANGRGGMVSKFATAKDLAATGIVVYIVDGKRPNVLRDIIEGKSVGTKFLPSRG